MLIGIGMVGVVLGAAAGGMWIFAGGSLLIAVALYSLIGTLLVLGSAIVAFAFSGHPKKGDEAFPGGLQATR